MPEPITCSSCRRPFNAVFVKCPFCNAPAPGRQAAAQPPPPPPPPPPPRQPAPDFAALAEQAIAGNRPLLDLEFHPAALAALDAFFDLTWGTEGIAPGSRAWSPTDGQKAVILSFGSFLGELLRRELGGRWRTDPASILQSCVVLPNGDEAFPIARVYLRFRDGVKEAFGPLHTTIRIRLGVRSSPAEAEGWLRQAQHFAAVSRPDIAAGFCQKALSLGPTGEVRARIEAFARSLPAA